MTERSLLLAVAKNCHGEVLHDLVHENTHDVSVLVSYVLFFSVHVVRSEDNVREVKHFFRNFEFLFHCKLGYAVGSSGFGSVFSQRSLPASVNCYG